MSILKLENSIIVNSIVQKLESTLKEFDVTFVCKNGRKSVTKLLLACWSTFWKDLLLELDNQNEITIILPDVENTVLEKVFSFLVSGQVKISGAQENIEVLAALEIVLPDLEFNNSQKLLIEDIVRDKESNKNKKDDILSIFDVKEDYICNICLKYFSRKEARDNHIKNMHLKSGSCSCKVCGKILYSKNGLSSHMKTHKSDQKKHKCTDCDKTYKYFSDLIRHCRTKEHTYPERDQEKKSNKAILYEKCKVCKKDIDRTYMTSHIESSHGEKSKKIKCDKCDFVTNRMDSLYRHERQIHNLFNMKVDAISKTISSKGKICCYDCGKEFTNVEKAENHMLETNCKPNKCNTCEKVFSQRSNLLLHIRDVHEGNKSVCNKCGKKFKQKRNLTRHA